MPLVWDVAGFLAKAIIIVVALLVIIGAIAAAVRRSRGDSAHLVVRRLNERFERLANTLRGAVVGHKKLRRHLKEQLKRRKKDDKRRRVFVLDFHGDMAASVTQSLRHEVSAILAVAEPGDEVVLRLESPGGVVHGYGLAASQLVRLREHKVKLTACVDKVAASGGYMMAAVADEIIAAPFAIIGSIGVVAQVPNLHRLLEEHGVDYEEMTAGEFKRTVSVLGKISPEGKKKFQEQLEDTHALFKDFVQVHRPKVVIDRVATGEYWFGRRAKDLGLVDRLQTSDDYVLSMLEGADVFSVSYRQPRPLRQRLASGLSDALFQAGLRLWGIGSRPPLA
jgi:serine protease SohB